MYLNEIIEKRLGIFQRRVPWQQMPSRTIYSNVPDTQIPNNQIETSKYSLLTFLPLNLLDQFSKMANVYFLITAVLQSIELISITNGVPVMLGPLSIVISISMLKDFVEDLQRHKSDKEENQRETLVLTPNGWQVRTWQQLLVGDLVKTIQDQYFPADMTILITSELKGQCFIETKNLDGETNLKNKQHHIGLSFLGTKTAEELFQQKLLMTYEKPNPFLYKFLGQIEVNNEKLALDQNNFVLRGCSLRNSRWCIGLVAYNGHDTKIMLNSVKARPKKSRLELLMNQLILLIFAIQMITCFCTALKGTFWLKSNIDSLPYLQIVVDGPDDDFIKSLFTKWGNWVLIFTNFVPISLLVTLEMVKFIQGIMITLDKGTTSSDNIVASVQSSNLNEELGQVSYIFSDKTGTLTKNIMNFKSLTIGGKAYGDSYSVRFTPDDELQLEQQVTNVDFCDRRLLMDMRNEKSEQSNRLNEFMFCLSLCHTIITAQDENELIYNASSPDELALVNLARFCGWKFMGIDEHNQMKIQVKNIKDQYGYKLLHVLEFSSNRKRMSVILEDVQGQYILYTKGADSVIDKRLSPKTDAQIRAQTWSDLEQFASIGLRTLLLAKKIIPRDEFQIWNQAYLAACAQIEGRDDAMELMQDQIEVDLELLGGTAIEDQLQDNVGATIQALKDAGIQVWVLTGDKIETAINIGYACQLLSDQQEQIKIDGIDDVSVSSQLQQALDTLGKNSSITDYALIVSGDALIVIYKSLKFKEQLTYVAQKCKAVVACRVSPKQKQEIVTLVRQANPSVTTLAIGDGANDVNMITAAHVGVGLRGVEGQQAARASDYAIGEFQILKRLLLYHGRESYRKNSRLVLFNFFKNMMLVLPQFWYGFYNGFSAVILYNTFLYQCYNLFFTSLPIVIYAIFDEEFSAETLTSNSMYYQIGLKNTLFNYKVFFYWVGFGAFQAMVIGTLTFHIFEGTALSNDGFMGTFFATGTTILGYAIYNANLKILLFSNTHTIGSLLSVILSCALFVIGFFIISDLYTTSDSYNTFSQSFGVVIFYLATYVLIGSTTLLDLCFTRWDTFSQFKNETTLKIVQNIELMEQSTSQDSPLVVVNIQESPKSGRRHSGFAYASEEPHGSAQRQIQI